MHALTSYIWSTQYFQGQGFFKLTRRVIFPPLLKPCIFIVLANEVILLRSVKISFSFMFNEAIQAYML